MFAVLVEGALGGQVVGDHLGVVSGQVWHSAIAQLYGMSVENTVEGVVGREASVVDV